MTNATENASRERTYEDKTKQAERKKGREKLWDGPFIHPVQVSTRAELTNETNVVVSQHGTIHLFLDVTEAFTCELNQPAAFSLHCGRWD